MAVQKYGVMKCPRDVDLSDLNLKDFNQFCPPYATVCSVGGETVKERNFPCRWYIIFKFSFNEEGDKSNNFKKAKFGAEQLKESVDNCKPTNTVILEERRIKKNEQYYWKFLYGVTCFCNIKLVLQSAEVNDSYKQLFNIAPLMKW